jgi:hypothetical protein
MGGAVAALAAVMLRERLGEAARCGRPASRTTIPSLLSSTAATAIREGRARARLLFARRASGVPPEAVRAVAFAPPAAVSPCLAAACRTYVTSVVLDRDFVPRCGAGPCCAWVPPRSHGAGCSRVALAVQLLCAVGSRWRAGFEHTYCIV